MYEYYDCGVGEEGIFKIVCSCRAYMYSCDFCERWCLVRVGDSWWCNSCSTTRVWTEVGVPRMGPFKCYVMQIGVGVPHFPEKVLRRCKVQRY